MEKLEQHEHVRTSWWQEYFMKMRGQHLAVSHRTNMADALTAAVGGFIGIGTLLLLTYMTGTPWLIASLGASCVLVFGAWNAPFSQPRNILGGHIISGTIGILFYELFGAHPLAISAAVARTIFIMMLTKMIHPPGGGNPIIMLGGYSWSYLFAPIIVGAVVIIVYAVILNNIRQNRHYPLFWW